MKNPVKNALLVVAALVLLYVLYLLVKLMLHIVLVLLPLIFVAGLIAAVVFWLRKPSSDTSTKI